MSRPMYFLVVVWGQRYQDYLLEKCIPTFLSPGNIPALKGQGHKFLIAMPFPERDRLEAHPNWQRLCKYVEPVFVHIESGPYDKAACKHMGKGHLKLTQIAHQDKAYGVMLTPDMMISDGAVKRLQELAEQGFNIVWTAAMRFNEALIYSSLEGVQIDRDLTPRVLANAALKSMHTESRHCEWDAAWFYQSAPHAWWKFRDGIILHAMSWNTLLFDYSAIEHHDTNTLEKWTMDGDYVWRNFGGSPRLHLVQDSDEMIQVSWTPEVGTFNPDPSKPGKPRVKRHQAWIESPKNPDNIGRELGKRSGLTVAQTFWAGQDWFHSATFDPIKKRVFWRPVYWHTHDLGPEWDEKDAEIRKYMEWALNMKSEHPEDIANAVRREQAPSIVGGVPLEGQEDEQRASHQLA